MFIDTTINFRIKDNKGYHGDISITTYLDTEEGLLNQCKNEALDWIDRKNRIHNSNIELVFISNAIYFRNGKWIVSTSWEN